jgi:hypothetical protein
VSHFQNSVSFENGFAFAPVSSKPCANAALQGSNFKMLQHFEIASSVAGKIRLLPPPLAGEFEDSLCRP